MSTHISKAWNAAQAIGTHLTVAEGFLASDDRLGGLESVRAARECLGILALALADEHEDTKTKKPAWMTPAAPKPASEHVAASCAVCGITGYWVAFDLDANEMRCANHVSSRRLS